MSRLLSRMFSSSAQKALGVLTWVDRRWGNELVSLDHQEQARSPYSRLPELREKGGVLRVFTINGWVVIGHSDVKELFRDKRISSEITDNAIMNLVVRSSARGLAVPMLDNPNMLNRDAPDHTRLRRLSSQSFTNRFVQSLTL